LSSYLICVPFCGLAMLSIIPKWFINFIFLFLKNFFEG
jgi:hypothetical protein